MDQFDVWLRQQVVIAYLQSVQGNPKTASVIIGEVAEIVDFIKTGNQLKAPEKSMD